MMQLASSITSRPERAATVGKTSACAAYLARRLRPTDELEVITYDDDVRLELTTPCCEVDPASAPTSRGTA